MVVKRYSRCMFESVIESDVRFSLNKVFNELHDLSVSGACLSSTLVCGLRLHKTFFEKLSCTSSFFSLVLFINHDNVTIVSLTVNSFYLNNLI